ncbi:MAG: xanthine dehydrogenase family protein molybdopterin-binding subunit [Pseudomonadota bacterium]
MTKRLSLARRAFLATAGGAGVGLAVGFRIEPAGAVSPAAETAFNPFLRIAPDGKITVIVKHIEFGQGANTGLATLVAEELDADWSKVTAESAPGNAELYANLFWGGAQGTGGSSAIANSYDQYREAGATARAMLLQAAAERLGVPASEIRTEQGQLIHGENHLNYGEVAEAAAALPAPTAVSLKPPSEYRLIGESSLRRVDGAAKTDGSALFALDLQLPGMLYATVAHSPRFGGRVASFDGSAAAAVPGVEAVVEIPSGVAVVARNTWAALKGRDALDVTWNDDAAETRSSATLVGEFLELAERPGAVAATEGDVSGALAAADQVVELTYEFPFLAHAPMETLDAVVRYTPGEQVELWFGSQAPTIDQTTVAAMTGLEPSQIHVNTMLAGGSFGRRATPNADIASEATAIAMALDGRAPIKLMWTREDDIQGGFYRPIYVHKLRGGLDASGRLVAWEQRIVGQSILAGTPFSMLIEDGIDLSSVEGASDLAYAVPALQVELHSPTVGVPGLWWRAVGHTHTGYATETFVDALAAAAGADPFAFRQQLLQDKPRHLGVLELAAERAGWSSPAPEGVHRGIAVHESFNSFVAQVAEVRLDDGRVKVERVVCAVDCGRAINPDQVRAQMEGGIGYGLGAVLRDAITLTDGYVDQQQFDTYEPLRIDDMPHVEVHIVASEEAPTGVGEPGTPVIGPAVANAIFAATGRMPTRLPFTNDGLV